MNPVLENKNEQPQPKELNADGQTQPEEGKQVEVQTQYEDGSGQDLFPQETKALESIEEALPAEPVIVPATILDIPKKGGRHEALTRAGFKTTKKRGGSTKSDFIICSAPDRKVVDERQIKGMV